MMYKYSSCYSAALFFLVSIYSSLIYAECSGTNCSDVIVDRLVVRANGNVSIRTSGDETLLSCDSGAKGYLELDRNATNYDAMYSLLLAVHTTKKPIWVRTTDSGICEVVYVVSDV